MQQIKPWQKAQIQVLFGRHGMHMCLGFDLAAVIFGVYCSYRGSSSFGCAFPGVYCPLFYTFANGLRLVALWHRHRRFQVAGNIQLWARNYRLKTST